MAEADTQQQQLEQIGHADIVLGVFSYNSAETIAHIVRAGQEALAAYFPQSRAVLVNVEGSSNNGTATLAQEAALDRQSFLQVSYPVPRLAIEHYGMPGKVNAYQAVFGVAGKLTAKVCAIVDGNTGTFSGEWVEALVRPVYEQQFDLVSACYLRHKYDAPILNGIVYPFMRALYGKRIHQPISGDFAFSGNLMDFLMRQPQLDNGAGAFAIDAWIATRAVCGNFRLAQTFLGTRTLKQNEPPPELSAVLADALAPIFAEMEGSASLWQRIRSSEAVPTYGSDCETAEDAEGEGAPIDVQPMVDSFRLGFQNLQGIWRTVLPPATLVDLKRMAQKSADSFTFEDGLWARVIYDFALAYRSRIMDRNHLLRALTPIYLGWVAAYILSVRDKGAKEAQHRIETLCLAYESQKAYFISRWRWPDRFNP
jgi:hypothetical protein